MIVANFGGLAPEFMLLTTTWYSLGDDCDHEGMFETAQGFVCTLISLHYRLVEAQFLEIKGDGVGKVD